MLNDPPEPNTILCPHCGERHPAGAHFCPLTGQTIQPAAELLCPHCQSTVDPTWSTCPACGHRLGPPPVPEKRNRWLPWLVVNLVLVLVVLGGWYLLSSYGSTREIGKLLVQKLTGKQAATPPVAAVVPASQTPISPEMVASTPAEIILDTAIPAPSATPEEISTLVLDPTFTPTPTSTATPTSLPPPSPVPTLAQVFEWTTQIVQRSQAVGYFTSMAIDPSDHAHIGFYQDNSDLVWYGHNDSGDWQFDYVVGGQETGFHLSLALDSQNRPHIAYRLAGKSQTPEARYVRWTGSAWELFRLYGTVTAFSDLSLALGPGDQPYISFQDADSLNLVYAVFSSQQGWSYQTIDGASQECKAFPIRVDQDGYPHFSYQSREGSLKYAALVNGQLQRSVVDEAPGTGAFSDLALAQDGTPIIAYYDSSQSALKVAILQGDTWEITLVDNEGEVGTFPAIALGPGGDIHISYYDAGSQALKYAHGRDGAWQVYVVDDFGEVGKYNSIALDSQGLPHIAYLDETNEDLKLADAFRAMP